MHTNSSDTTTILINSQNLTALDRDTLIELLAHKTRLLVAASTVKLSDKEYIQQLNNEVEAIQKEVKARMSSRE